MISRQGETGRDWKATMEYAVEEAEKKVKQKVSVWLPYATLVT